MTDTEKKLKTLTEQLETEKKEKEHLQKKYDEACKLLGLSKIYVNKLTDLIDKEKKDEIKTSLHKEEK